jgi:hypothetical protein
MACEGSILENSRLEITAAESNELEITGFETTDEVEVRE